MTLSSPFAATAKWVPAPLVAACLALCTFPAAAQDNATTNADQPDYIESLKACQIVSDDLARLDCFDAAVGSMVTANEAGDVQVIDKEDVRQTRRSLFGFSLPDIGLFGGDDTEEADELFETTITGARYTGRNSAQFTTEEGAVWQLNNIPPRLRTIKAGDRVQFKEASLGYFFVRINGQTGIKGRRIQ